MRYPGKPHLVTQKGSAMKTPPMIASIQEAASAMRMAGPNGIRTFTSLKVDSAPHADLQKEVLEYYGPEHISGAELLLMTCNGPFVVTSE